MIQLGHELVGVILAILVLGVIGILAALRERESPGLRTEGPPTPYWVPPDWKPPTEKPPQLHISRFEIDLFYNLFRAMVQTERERERDRESQPR
jgi:hypothetical protein